MKTDLVPYTNEQWYDIYKNHNLIKIKSFDTPVLNHIESIHFKPKVFFKNKWDNETIRTRGLFVNKYDKSIISRGYDKFFNINEREETYLSNLKNIKYPLKSYIKYNGFLGVLSYDEHLDSLFVSSKTQPDNQYTEMFKNILFNKYINTVEKYNKIKNILKKYNVTFVFEVIDPINDNHPIDYTEQKLVLLDIIENSYEFNRLDDSKRKLFTETFNFSPKVLYKIINNFDTLKEIWNGMKDPNNEEWNNKEGLVVEDVTKKFLFKMKTSYYWKKKLGEEKFNNRFDKFFNSDK